MENRLTAFIACLSIAVGLVFGALFGGLMFAQSAVMTDSLTQLEPAAQTDFIIAAAEAFGSDGSLPLAQDRLARLHDPEIAARVESLARSYIGHSDIISWSLARLAVGLGSRNLGLASLSASIGEMPEGATPPSLSKVNATNSLEVALHPRSPEDALTLELSGGEPIASTSSEEDTAKRSSNPRITSSHGPPPGASVQPKQSAPQAAERTTTPQSTMTETQAPVQEPTHQRLPARAPKASSTPTPTRMPTRVIPTATLQPPTPNPSMKANGPMPANLIATLVPIPIPDHVGVPKTFVPLNARPSKCTPANEMPEVISVTLALCAGQVYAPLSVAGSNLTIFGDKEGTSIVQGKPRLYAITVTGNNVAIVGVHVNAVTDPADLNQWLCMYESCDYSVAGGAVGYGGGILLDHTTGSSVLSSTVSDGTAGIAVVHATGSRISENDMSGQNGWGVLLQFSSENIVVGNKIREVNRSCMSLIGHSYFQSGCESSGLSMIASPTNVIAGNNCMHVANCYYADGEFGMPSNNNKVYDNYCAAAGNNCFEFTFSADNRFDYNTATADPSTGETCDYPFWVAGSSVFFGPHNTWSCLHDMTTAIKDSTGGTVQLTQVQIIN